MIKEAFKICKKSTLRNVHTLVKEVNLKRHVIQVQIDNLRYSDNIMNQEKNAKVEAKKDLNMEDSF